MEDKLKYSSEYLEKCSYRALQQIAKSLCLPCIFKKIYLIELILAKYVKNEKELRERINCIRLERSNHSSRRKTTSENSYFMDKNTRGMLSPPITSTPKRTYLPRRSSPRFKNLFIRYRPKTLIRRSTSPPKTYSSPKTDNEKERVPKRTKNILSYESNEIFINNNCANNNVTPEGFLKEYDPEEEKGVVNVCEVIPPPENLKIYSSNSSQGSHSNEGHIKNVSGMCEALHNSGVKQDEEYPTKTKTEGTNEEGSSKFENLTELKDSNNNIIIHSMQQIQPNIKDETNTENDKADEGTNVNISQESIFDFPDQFGFQNSYANIEENYSAVELLESFLESPEENLQNLMEDLETIQCVICSRTGTKNVLEGHIKEKHSTRIHKDCGGEWALKFNLGDLTCLQIWCSEVLEHDSVLYLVSVKYQDPDYCMVTISKLSSKPTIQKIGSITLYNSLTGEPHTWKGPIQPFSTNLPYYNENKGLKIKLEKLNLLPNSANLKLINRELVNSSLSKVIVGQPELKNVYLMVYVTIL